MLDTLTFFNKIESQFNSNLPFVAYAKPNANEVIALLQEDSQLFEVGDFKESGFVFAPFNDKNASILFPLDKAPKINTERSNFYADDNVGVTTNSKINEAKIGHLNLVEKAIKGIEDNQFSKVVISRNEVLKLDKQNIFSIFKNLLNTYKTAFVYCWYHPKIGLWLGATPERLLKISGQQFSTMALAGTQTYKGSFDVK